MTFDRVTLFQAEETLEESEDEEGAEAEDEADDGVGDGGFGFSEGFLVATTSDPHDAANDQEDEGKENDDV